MFNIIPKIILTLLFWGAFILIVLNTPYPESLTQANYTQLLAFFIPLSLALTFTFNIFLANILLSLSITLGIIFALILQALDSLNIVTGILIIISVGLLVSYFNKRKRRSPSASLGFKNLTKLPKMPKLRHFEK